MKWLEISYSMWTRRSRLEREMPEIHRVLTPASTHTLASCEINPMCFGEPSPGFMDDPTAAAALASSCVRRACSRKANGWKVDFSIRSWLDSTCRWRTVVAD